MFDNIKACAEFGCGRKIYKGEYCKTHYNQKNVHGKTFPIRKPYNIPNEIINSGEYSELVLYRKNGKELTRVKIDHDSIDLVKNIRWSSNHRGYARGVVDGKRTLMHKLIAKHNGLFGEIDHINTNQMDNRVENLRVSTHMQNCMNRGINKNNKTGMKGVSWHKQKGKYRAQIQINGKFKSLGLYSDINDAAIAYDAAAIKYVGEYAKTNILKIQNIT